MSLNKITGANRNSVRTSLDNAQPAVGGDVNPIIDFVNNISSESTSVNTATSASAAVTLNAISGTITTEGLTTAADTTATLTVTNAYCTTASTVLCTIAGGTSTTGAQVLIKVVPSNGSFVISFRNVHASAALNGTLIFKFIIL